VFAGGFAARKHSAPQLTEMIPRENELEKERVRAKSHRDATQEALRIANERYEMAAQAAGVGVWDWNMQTGEFYLDPNVKMLLGYTDEEIPNDIEVWTTYVHPDDRQAVMEAAQAHIEGRTPEYIYEHRMLHKDGSARWILVRGTAIRDAQGNAIRLVGTDTDITRLKQTEQALRESEERARAIFNATMDTIHLLGRDGTILETNKVGAERYGKRVDELLGVCIYDLFPPDLAASRRARIEQVVHSGNPVRFEDERAGRAFDSSLYPILDAQGKVEVIAVYARDVTERRRVEEALRESEVRFRSIVEQSRDGITLFDEQGKIAEWNQATEQLTGVGRAEAIGQYAWDVQFQALPELERSPERYARIKAALQHFFETGQGPWSGQLQEANVRHVDGTRRAVQQSSFAIETAQGFMLGAISRDITERKQAEMALDRRVEELAALNQITKTVATVADLPAVLGQVSQVVASLSDARCTCIVLPTAGENGTIFLHGFQRETGILEPTPLDPALADFSLYRWVFSQAEPLVVSASDWQSESLTDFPLIRQALSQADPQAGSASDRLSQLVPPVVREVLTPESLQSLLLMPLVVHGVAIGFMVVATDQASRSYTAHDVSLAETIAGDIAAAVENTRLLEQARAVAVAEERSRLARDLHDAVTQTIYSATLIAEALPQVWARNPAEGQRNLVKLRQLVRGALAEMRTLLFELRPTALEAASLSTLLRHLGDAFTGRTRIPVEVAAGAGAEDETELPPEVKLALYRIAQEAFNNIAKHARATQVTAGLQRRPNEVMLTIQDDGRGFAPESVSAERMGVHIMRERAESIGATLTIESVVGRGTEITVVWIEDEGRRTEDGE